MIKRIRKLADSRFLRSKVTYAIVIIVLLYLFIYLVQEHLLNLLSTLPLIAPLYKLVSAEIARKSAIGLFMIALFGSLFFLSYPAEVIYLIYVGFGYNPFYAACIMLAAIAVSQVINYYAGVFLGAKILHVFVSQPRKEYSGFIQEHGELFIVMANVVPLPADILTTILGIIRYRFRDAILYSFLGQLIKYLLLASVLFMLGLFT